MNFGSFNSIRAAIAGLGFGDLIWLGLLAACAIGGASVGIYVAIRSALDIWNIRHARRLRRKTRTVQRATMQHARK